ncbi:WD40 repeat domain-containing protein [Anaeromyxobacter sp. Red801]|uniref:WD40 repeat domain-containing protein n=1 Tax=Anaeromyxobacter sp. Red801 TaxID=3411632 RepID=UPI003BA18569
MENATYDASAGIQETPVVGLSTDENQNRWLATPSALYLLRPGETQFRRFDERDGLHMGANRMRYCRDRPVRPETPCADADVSWGVAAPEGIRSIVGGGPDEVFVGYHGVHASGWDCAANGDGEDWCDPDRHSGKIDRVRLNADGTLSVERFDLLAGNHGAKYWHDRSIYRMVYDHFAHPHTLYAGTEHGVDLLFPDRFRWPDPPMEWLDSFNDDYMGDHLHASVCKDAPCDGTGANQRLGDWAGLAIDANGDLWHAGRWAAGLITWDPDPFHWFARNGAAFKVAFGDPYYPDGTGNMPVFPVANEGHDVLLTGVAVCPDGTVWFSSAGPADGVMETVASWDGHRFTHYLSSALGLGERPVRDIACLPDGRVVVAGYTTGISIWDPATRTSRSMRAGSGLPSDRVTAIEVDRMPAPPTLHVSTAGGAAAIRVLP